MMSKPYHSYHEGQTDPPASTGGITDPLFNPDDYMDDLDEYDISEEQKLELLQCLWTIMSAFVDLGWGLDSVQLLLPDLFKNVASDSPELLVSDNNEETKVQHIVQQGGPHE